MLKMKLRDDIGPIDQGVASEVAAPTDKWVVAYHQVPDRHPPGRKIPGCSSVYGGAGWDDGRGFHALTDPLGWFYGLWRLHALRGWH